MVALNWTLLVVNVLAFFGSVFGAPFNLENLFTQFESPNDSDLFKRQVQHQPVANQVNLNSLIKNLEHNIVASALSVQPVALNDDAVIEEITPATTNDGHTVTKRHTEQQQQNTNTKAVNAETPAPTTTTTAPQPTAEHAQDVLLLTTERVPAKNGTPQHIVIDRISIHPHNGGISLLPGFQVQRTKVVSAVVKEPTATTISGEADKQTQISITQTVIKATGASTQTTQQVSSTVAATANSSPQSDATTTVTTDKTLNKGHDEHATDGKVTEKIETTKAAAAAAETTTTTKAPIVELKEAEKELKEKVAEIEADPVILSARV